jgi:glutathione synthase/RimK-type ligase-like ATP-grasp enzyme
MNEKTILIISNKQDVTTDLVVRRLQQKSIPYLRMNTETFPLDISCSVKVGSTGDYSEIITPKLSIRSNQLKSIWYRRPVAPDFDSVNMSENEKEFAKRECVTFLSNLWTSMSDVKWVNDFYSSLRAEQKTLQLQTASECGLKIPETLVSNNPDEINRFIDINGGKVIAKPISHGSIGKNEEAAIFANSFDEFKGKIAPEEIRVSPFIIQKSIEKVNDIRLTVFGQTVFAYKITTSDSSKSIMMDWRKHEPQELTYLRCEPPASLMKSIYNFMNRLNILYGAFDFCLSKNGDWTFLEVNPSGQFAWLELATGDPLIDALIDLLWS